MSIDEELFASLEGQVAPELIARMRDDLVIIRAEFDVVGLDETDHMWALINHYGFGPDSPENVS